MGLCKLLLKECQNQKEREGIAQKLARGQQRDFISREDGKLIQFCQDLLQLFCGIIFLRNIKS